MRKHFLGLILAGFIASSCGDGSKDEKGSLTDKKVELEGLKKEQASIGDKIRKLEEEIALLDTSANKGSARLVGVTTLGTQNFVHYIDLQGKVEAENISIVSPRLGPGLVKAVYVKQGQQVRKGQLLLKLDDAVLQQQIAASRQGLESIRAQLTLARDVYNRQNNLWKQGIGTEVQLLQAKTNVATLESQLATAQAGIRATQEQASASNVYAEVSGIADEVNIRPGETFTGMTATGQPQVRIVNTSSLKAVVDVPENYSGKVKKGAKVVVSLPDIGKTDTLTITRAGQLIDPVSRAFQAEITMPADPAIRPNQLAQVRIQDYAAPGRVVIPVNTVQTDENGKYVFVAVKEGDRIVARKRSIGVGEFNGDMIEVLHGLKTGEQLVTDGYQNLYEGQVLTIAAK